MSRKFSVIHGLFGSLWPVHIKPLPDELLSSWLVRLAHAHGYKVETLCRILLGPRANMWNRDVDRSNHPELMRSVLTATSASEQQFFQSTLLSYEGTLSERYEVAGTARWIISLAIFHRTRRRPGLMYCRLCLASDSEPYFRKKWRLACMTVCTQHRVNLEDTCPHCQAPVMPHRADVGFHSFVPTDRLLVRCYRCGCDLRRGLTISSDEKLIAFTRKVEKCINDGFTFLGHDQFIHSLAFMNGLRLLLRASRKIVNRQSGSERPVPSVEFEHLGVADRIRLMLALADILTVGPGHLAEKLGAKSLKYSDVVTVSESPPFWLLDALLPLKRAQHPNRSSEEMRMLADASEHRAGRVSALLIKQMFGAYIHARNLPLSHRSTVSAENYELLMMSLDQSVGATFSVRHRLAFLQDKVMFALLRTTDLTTKGLAQMQCEDVKSTNVTAEFETEPRSASQAFAWLKWHAEYLRPQISASPRCRHVFVSPFTRESLGATAIQARFKVAVERAELSASIGGLTTFKKSN